MHLNSELLFRRYALPFFKSNLKVLEIGPGTIPSVFNKLINNSEIEWHTLDFSGCGDNLTYIIESPYDFPVENDYYDIVFSAQVMEHVEKIWLWLKEIKRVVKKDGLIITINPVSWPYHLAPVDCWRIYPSGIKALADELNLCVELCLFESLEEKMIKDELPYVKIIPGKSYKYGIPGRKIRAIKMYNNFLHYIPFFKNYFGIPIEAAFDTISILKKNES
ncbi:hypothetical protein BH10BAC2_BH10BAC2_16350 [soil metagenome]